MSPKDFIFYNTTETSNQRTMRSIFSLQFYAFALYQFAWGFCYPSICFLLVLAPLAKWWQVPNGNGFQEKDLINLLVILGNVEGRTVSFLAFFKKFLLSLLLYQDERINFRKRKILSIMFTWWTHVQNYAFLRVAFSTLHKISRRYYGMEINMFFICLFTNTVGSRECTASEGFYIN